MAPNTQPKPGSTLEWIVPAVFLLVTLCFPLSGVVDCYPLSGAPMFNQAPRVYCEYRAFDGKGAELPLDLLGLQRNDNGNPPGHGHGRKPHYSIDRLGSVPSPDQIEAGVLKRLNENQINVHGMVKIEIKVIRDLDGNQIGEDPLRSRIQVVQVP